MHPCMKASERTSTASRPLVSVCGSEPQSPAADGVLSSVSTGELLAVAVDGVLSSSRSSNRLGSTQLVFGSSALEICCSQSPLSDSPSSPVASQLRDTPSTDCCCEGSSMTVNDRAPTSDVSKVTHSPEASRATQRTLVLLGTLPTICPTTIAVLCASLAAVSPGRILAAPAMLWDDRTVAARATTQVCRAALCFTVAFFLGVPPAATGFFLHPCILTPETLRAWRLRSFVSLPLTRAFILSSFFLASVMCSAKNWST
mmetsp:Transcript_47521/g.97146  ORF Transcript_47521/g.97146 Transcript_47521/m.97146 type:complete len:258 (+) Transcript_47521:1085-1858(+)